MDMQTSRGLAEWVQERLDNCEYFASVRTGEDRNGWIEDAGYFSQLLASLAESSRLEEQVKTLREALASAALAQPSDVVQI